ncbi:MAG: hypothetical protein Q4F41_20830 [Eubacteriales bacterium]|nr:hypothetical protein [Eubacteriales bacterium]
MTQCIKCGLPASYQGISLNAQGVCNFCSFFEEEKERLLDEEALEEQFQGIIRRAKEEAAARNAKYDCLVGLSGGKDSTYIIYQLKHTYGMRVLAFTLDNGFSTEYGRKNIENALAKLDVDHIRIAVNETQLRTLYSKSVKLLHNFCSVCFHLMHYYSFQIAAWNQIPLIVNGRTKGQILQSAAGKRGIEPFEASHSLKEFEYQMFGKLVDKLDGYSCLDLLPDVNAEAVSYFAYHDISEEETMEFLEEKIGWTRPENKVKHADCWAHAMAEKMSLEKHGYPIRTGELAVLVRYGKLSREEAETILQEDREQFSEIAPEIRERFENRIRL